MVAIWLRERWIECGWQVQLACKQTPQSWLQLEAPVLLCSEHTMEGILAQTVLLLLLAVCGAAGLALLFVVVYIWRESLKYAHLPGPKTSR